MERYWAGTNGKYQVSNLGRVKSLSRITNVGIKNNKTSKRKERILKLQLSTKKYLQTRLYDENLNAKTVKVHRIVAQTFIPNPDNKPQINHIDGNKLNNCADNLEWCTNNENMKHSWDIGLRDRNKVADNMRLIAQKRKYKKGHHTRKVGQYDKNNNLIKIWETQTEASKAVGVTSTSICNVCRGQIKSAGGYIWRYVWTKYFWGGGIDVKNKR